MNLRAYDSLDQPPDAPEAAKSKLVVPLAVVAQVSELKPFFMTKSRHTVNKIPQRPFLVETHMPTPHDRLPRWSLLSVISENKSSKFST